MRIACHRDRSEKPFKCLETGQLVPSHGQYGRDARRRRQNLQPHARTLLHDQESR